MRHGNRPVCLLSELRKATVVMYRQRSLSCRLRRECIKCDCWW